MFPDLPHIWCSLSMFPDLPHIWCSLSPVVWYPSVPHIEVLNISHSCNTMYLMSMWQRIKGYFYNEMRYINLRFTYLLYLQEINVISHKGE